MSQKTTTLSPEDHTAAMHILCAIISKDGAAWSEEGKRQQVLMAYQYIPIIRGMRAALQAEEGGSDA